MVYELRAFRAGKAAARLLSKGMDISALPNNWNRKTRECRIIIETPKGRRNKFKYEPDSGLFALGSLLPEGLVFPFDFGFVPSTLGGDADPMDVMVLMDEPAHVGCLLDARIIGVIEAEQTEDGKKTRNDRLLAVAVHSYSHEELTTIEEVSRPLLDQVIEFFVSYNKSRGKRFRVTGLHGPGRAAAVLQASIQAFKQKDG